MIGAKCCQNFPNHGSIFVAYTVSALCVETRNASDTSPLIILKRRFTTPHGTPPKEADPAELRSLWYDLRACAWGITTNDEDGGACVI